MAAWGSLKDIFENPMQDSCTQWGQLLPLASSASFEMFGELCHPSSSTSSHFTSPLLDRPPPPPPPPPRQCIHTMSEADDTCAIEIFGELCYAEKADFSPKIPEGLASADCNAPISAAAKMEEGRFGYMRSKSTGERSGMEKMKLKEVGGFMRSYSDVRQRIAASGIGGRGVAGFPPPITTIGSYGKPRVYFKSFRKDGRFVLREIKIPMQRLLHATREDGRLTMRVLRPKDEEEEAKEGGKEDGGDMKSNSTNCY